MKSSYALSPNIVLRKIEDETVILTPDDGFVHQLNKTASDVLDYTLKGFDCYTIAGIFCIESWQDDGTVTEDIYRDVDSCISDLINKGILIHETS